MKFIKSKLKSIPIFRYYLAGKSLLNDKYYLEGEKLTRKERKKTPRRTDIINFLLSTRKDKTCYLEIGVRYPTSNFDKIVADEKHSVDPGVEFEENPVEFKVTSDEFFEGVADGKFLSPDVRFDVIFVDGLHLAYQVEKDIENSLKYLKDDGFIVLHDCNPPTEWHARENFYFGFSPAGRCWNGTTWKAYQKQRFNSSIQSCCIDSDWGVGILSRHHPLGDSIPEANPYYEFDDLEANRREYLNLMSFDELKDLLS